MKIPKGIKVSDLRVGTGALAAPDKFALIDYDCYLPRGELCDTSRDKPSPVQVAVRIRDEDGESDTEEWTNVWVHTAENWFWYDITGHAPY